MTETANSGFCCICHVQANVHIYTSTVPGPETTCWTPCLPSDLPDTPYRILSDPLCNRHIHMMHFLWEGERVQENEAHKDTWRMTCNFKCLSYIMQMFSCIFFFFLGGGGGINWFEDPTNYLTFSSHRFNYSTIKRTWLANPDTEAAKMLHCTKW